MAPPLLSPRFVSTFIFGMIYNTKCMATRRSPWATEKPRVPGLHWRIRALRAEGLPIYGADPVRIIAHLAKFVKKKGLTNRRNRGIISMREGYRQTVGPKTTIKKRLTAYVCRLGRLIFFYRNDDKKNKY